jgi:hypothetical protein
LRGDFRRMVIAYLERKKELFLSSRFKWFQF